MTTEALELVAVVHELSVEQVIARIGKVHDVMKRAMQDGHHYGIIPGTPKPTLLKPGAELLCVMFRLDPQYAKDERREPDGHLSITSTCTLWHIPTGQRMGSGMGSCSTRESKYAYRQETRKCPKCGEPAIIKGKTEYGGGWLCFKKKGGCGEKFADKDPAIVEQPTGRVANEDLADQENTVLKMSNKRALVAAVLNVTAASDIFTQDLEDAPREEVPPPPAPVVIDAPGAQAALLNEPDSELPLNEEEERAVLLGKVSAAAAKLGLNAHTRAKQWEMYCGKATKDNVDVSALQALYAALTTSGPARG